MKREKDTYTFCWNQGIGMDERQKQATDQTGGRKGNYGFIPSFSSSLISITTTLLKVTLTTNWWAALLVQMRKQRIHPLPTKINLM